MRTTTRKRVVRARPVRQRLTQAILAGIDRLCATLPSLPMGAGWPHALLWLVAGLVLMFLMAPILLILPISFTASTFVSFPPDGMSLRWYRTLIDDGYWADATLLSLRGRRRPA